MKIVSFIEKQVKEYFNFISNIINTLDKATDRLMKIIKDIDEKI